MKMEQRQTLEIVVLVALLSLTSTASAASASTPIPFVAANHHWLVISQDTRTLVVRSLDTGKAWTRSFPSDVCHLELCPDCAYLSYRTECSAPGAPDGPFALMDLTTRHETTDPILHLDGDEQRWGPRGSFAFFREESTLWLVPDDSIGAFLDELSDTRHPTTGIQITGHPLGFIWQQSWLGGDLLIIGTGVGEMACWGLADPGQESVEFLTCCGLPGIEKYSAPCRGAIADPWPLFAADGVFSPDRSWPEVGLDFYDGVWKLLKPDKGDDSPTS